jgi:hypothetical protein
MATFLFWNIGGRDLTAHVVALAIRNDVDVLILAESAIDDVRLLNELNYQQNRIFRIPPLSLSPRLKFYVRYRSGSFESLFDEGGISLRLVRPPVGREMLLVAVHLPSKMYRRDHEQTIIATELSRLIRQKEEELGHKNTMVIGDFNMDPFEQGFVAAHGMHAVSDRTIALKESRVVDGDNLPFFYNPMWNFLGDDNSRPPGTYYYGSGEVSHFWHAFDQVLLRPKLLDAFSVANLKIITEVEGTSLIRNGRIDNNIADHLPIAIKLELQRLK